MHETALARSRAFAERLRSADAVPPRVAVSGHVYDIATGLVDTVIPMGVLDPAA